MEVAGEQCRIRLTRTAKPQCHLEVLPVRADVRWIELTPHTAFADDHVSVVVPALTAVHARAEAHADGPRRGVFVHDSETCVVADTGKSVVSGVGLQHQTEVVIAEAANVAAVAALEVGRDEDLVILVRQEAFVASDILPTRVVPMQDAHSKLHAHGSTACGSG